MAYMATRVDGVNKNTGRSTFSAAGQSMMSPRMPANMVSSSPVYNSAYPYPGANSKIEKQFPGETNETMYTNDTPGIGTLRGNMTVPSASGFMNITPRTRRERSVAQDNDAVVRQNLQQEHSRHYRSRALAENNNFARAFSIDQTSSMAGTTDERYKGNAHEMLKAQNDSKIAARKQFLDNKRMNVMTEEQQRWNADNTQADASDDRWDEIRASSLKAKSNLNSLPYNPISLQTKESADGLQYEYEEGLMTYRAALRSKNLYGRYNANGFNPINGQELWDVRMPDRPMQPSEVMVAQEAMKKLDAVKAVKQKLFEVAGGMGIRAAGKILRGIAGASGGMIGNAGLSNGLARLGVQGVSPLQVQNVMSAFNNTDGQIFVEELLRALRGAISERRKALVGMAWQRLDFKNEGYVAVQYMLSKYDVGMMDDVVEGRKTREEAVQDFLNTWDRDPQGVLTWDEFFEYYADIGAYMRSDDDFDAVIRSAWQLPGGSAAFASTTRLRVLVLHKSGDWTIEEVPGGMLPNNLRGSALMAEVKRRFREDGREFLEIKLREDS